MKRWDGGMEHEEMGWRNGTRRDGMEKWNMKRWDGGMEHEEMGWRNGT